MRFQMLKRDIRLFLRCLLPAAALTAAFAAVCAAAALAAVKGAEDVYTPVKAAVVDGEHSVFSRMLVHGVAKTDYIADLMDVSLCGMEEAMEGLESGELAAVIVLPDRTFDGILSGVETRGKIYLSPAAAAHADIVASVASFGELLLASGQYGVFSGQHLVWKYGLGDPFESEFLAKTNAALLSEAMRANSSYFDVQVTDYADTAMSTAAYYAVSWIALLLMLSVLFFAPLYTQDLKKPMLCRLRGIGVKDGWFLIGKLLCPALFQVVILAVILVVIRQRVSVNTGLAAFAGAGLGILLSASSGGVLMLLGHRGTPVAVVVSLAGLFLCGGMIPRQMLPDELLVLGSVTPYGAVQGLLRPLLGGEVDRGSLVAGILYLAAGPFAAWARVRQVRIGGEEP